MTEASLPDNVGTWLCEPLPRRVEQSLTALAQAEDVERVAVMPDVHLAHDVFIGTVVATRQLIYPAAVGEAGVIPGSMGSPSYHVTGRGHAAAMCSSSHGAGRSLSRTEAASSLNDRDMTRQMDGVWFDHRRAKALREEAPSAYKDITKVMQAQKELTRITRELRPRLCYKGT